MITPEHLQKLRKETKPGSHEYFMTFAIEEALVGFEESKIAIGCVIVDENGKIAARGHNMMRVNNDPTAHAEIVTLRNLGKNEQQRQFPGHTLYCTLQPCGMCSIATIWSKVSRIVYGAGRRDVNESFFAEKHLNTMDYIHDAYDDHIDVTGNILEYKCSTLYNLSIPHIDHPEHV